MQAKSPHPNHTPIIIWLYGVAALVFVMVIVGAITRLTDSGLSMVEWRPIYGFLPPMDAAEWERVFALYQASPEFQKKHFWMEMADFKKIFFWEWAHRVLGRLIGLAYGLPLLYFWLRGQIPKGFGMPLFGLFLLGGAQGLMGWYMVQSGLVDVPAVSHYRLAAHLGLAFLIFSLLIWVALSLRSPVNKGASPKSVGVYAYIVLAFIIVTIIWGAFTAGMDAGLVYNDGFPKMGVEWIPNSLWQLSPVILNFIENPVGIQFTHRWLAMFTTALIVHFWLFARDRGFDPWPIKALTGMALAQMSLGIFTLISQVWLPIAVLHQAGALILLGLLVATLHRLRPNIA